jgi:4'-phosphopantetheinyl transferase
MDMQNNSEGPAFHIIHIRQKDAMERAESIPELENNTLHLWTARYSDLDHFYGIFSDFLSQTEQKKASTFRKPADARRYSLRHGMVRFILGTYTRTSPGRVPLVTGRNGKPQLDLQPHDDQTITFSVSHTDEILSIGVMKKFEIGLDIVKIDPRYPILEIAEYLFCPREISYLQGTRPDQRESIFFTFWSMKEAIIKTTGEGLHGIQETDVMNILLNHTIPKDFFMCPFIPAPGYRGAVAVCVSGEK